VGNSGKWMYPFETILRERKALTPREIWDGIGVSKQGALDLLRPLIKAGVVRRIGTKKTGRYVLV